MPQSDLSRREMLGALLGVPALAVTCAPRTTLPPGEIVFPIERRGHAVRDGIHAAPSQWTSKDVVIVGGGVAGLSAAWRLVRAGLLDFSLLEIDDALGGTAKSGACPITAFPWGAHYITVPMKENRALLRLLGELGAIVGTDARGEPIVDEGVLCRDPPERIFYKGTWRPGLYLSEGASAEDREELARFRARTDELASARDEKGRRAFALPIARGSDDARWTELDRISMAEWMRREGFKSERLLWTIDYACRDDYGSLPEETSAWAGLFYFAARIADGKSDGQPVMTWPEGNGRLVRHLAEQIGDRVSLATSVFDVAPTDDGGVDVLGLAKEGPIGIHAKRVILAVPQMVARRIVRPYREERPAFLDAFTYGAWLVANLEVSERPKSRGFPFAWDNVLYESRSLGYVTATHQHGRDHGPTVLTYYHPMADEPPDWARARLLSASRDDWADAVLTDLGTAHPDLPRVTRRLDVIRWGHAMIRPRPGFFWGAERRRAAQPLAGIHFASTDLSGVALFEEAFDHGVRAAEEVLRERSIPFEPWR